MLKQKSLIYLVSNIIGSLSGFVSVIFVSRYMGASAMGVLSSTIACVSLFSFINDLGFGTAHARKIAEGVDLGKCIGTFFIIKVLLTVLSLIVVLVFFYGTYYFTGKYPIEEKHLLFFYIILFSALLSNILSVFSLTLSARLEVAKEAIVGLSQKIFSSVAKIIIALSGMGIIYLAWSNLITVIVGFAITVLLFYKYPFSTPSWDLFKSYWIFSIPLIILSFASVVSANIDKVFMSYWIGTTEVGYYSAAQSFIIILSFIGTIFPPLLFPTFTSFHTNNQVEEIGRLAFKIERYISLILMPIVIFLFIYSNDIVKNILGNSFIKSSIIIKILSMQAFFIVLSQPYMTQLAGINRIPLSVKIYVIGMSISVISMFILIPDHIGSLKLFGMGINGAAIGSLLGNTISTIMFRYSVFKLSNTKPNIRVVLHLIISLITYYTIFIFVNTYFEIKIIGLIVIGVVGFGIYVILLVVIKEVNYNDLNYYLRIIDPKLMKSYLREELRK